MSLLACLYAPCMCVCVSLYIRSFGVRLTKRERDSCIAAVLTHMLRRLLHTIRYTSATAHTSHTNTHAVTTAQFNKERESELYINTNIYRRSSHVNRGGVECWLLACLRRACVFVRMYYIRSFGRGRERERETANTRTQPLIRVCSFVGETCSKATFLFYFEFFLCNLKLKFQSFYESLEFLCVYLSFSFSFSIPMQLSLTHFDTVDTRAFFFWFNVVMILFFCVCRATNQTISKSKFQRFHFFIVHLFS